MEQQCAAGCGTLAVRDQHVLSYEIFMYKYLDMRTLSCLDACLLAWPSLCPLLHQSKELEDFSQGKYIPIVRLLNLLLTNYLNHPSMRLIRAQIKVDYSVHVDLSVEVWAKLQSPPILRYFSLNSMQGHNTAIASAIEGLVLCANQCITMDGRLVFLFKQNLRTRQTSLICASLVISIETYYRYQWSYSNYSARIDKQQGKQAVANDANRYLMTHTPSADTAGTTSCVYISV
ncbi:hypothetical protein BKA59DRAFT_468535, partial [Fusarium tricinctum]